MYQVDQILQKNWKIYLLGFDTYFPEEAILMRNIPDKYTYK